MGMLKIYLFYMEFNIDILSYMELSEIFQLQFMYLLIAGFLVVSIGAIGLDYYQLEGFAYDKSKHEFISSDGKKFIYPYLIFVWLLFAIGVIYFAGLRTSIIDSRSIRLGEAINEVTMITDDKHVITNDIFVYIGKTKNFIL